MIFLSALISSLSPILDAQVSRTLSSLPRRGNTPKRSRPTTLSPAMAVDLALSPSVRMRVHSALRRVPASEASSSLGRPVTLRRWSPSERLSVLRSAAALAARRRSCSCVLARMARSMASDTSYLVRKRSGGVVSRCLFWESKLGLGTRALTKSHSRPRTALAAAARSLSFSLPGTSLAATRRATAAATCSTCLPPLGVQRPLTKDTCRKTPSGLTATATSQSPPSAPGSSNAAPSPSRYSSTYCRKFLTGTGAPSRCTVVCGGVIAAASSTERRSMASTSLSMRSMPKRPRSGTNSTRVKDAPRSLRMAAGPTAAMLSRQVCWYSVPPSRVVTANSVEKMLVDLAPMPFCPATTRSERSS